MFKMLFEIAIDLPGELYNDFKDIEMCDIEYFKTFPEFKQMHKDIK